MGVQVEPRWLHLSPTYNHAAPDRPATKLTYTHKTERARSPGLLGSGASIPRAGVCMVIRNDLNVLPCLVHRNGRRLTCDEPYLRDESRTPFGSLEELPIKSLRRERLRRWTSSRRNLCTRHRHQMTPDEYGERTVERILDLRIHDSEPI